MTPFFLPTCRHRREPRSRLAYHCRSVKVAGLKVVTPEVCAACPYVDHPFPGDDNPVSDIHPAMDAEQLAELVAGPPPSWPPGWEDWEVTHQAHRLAAERFLDALSLYPEERFQGRGLVIAGGGMAYFPSLYVTVRAVRHAGWTLPIQVWYLGRENEMPPEYRALLEPFGVECVDADEVRERHPCRILNGWELKAFAVLHSPFAEVLSLDADCYPIRDPSVLFDDADYRQTGAVFWPDLWDAPPLDWSPFGLAPSGRVSIESGQFLVHKRLCWRPLQLAWWYNDHSDWSYLHGYGDKHTFEVAWARCGQRYTMFREDVEWSVHSFKHVGPDGRLLFVHRCKDKFRFGTPSYMNPQNFAANRFHPELPLETECFHWLGELEEELGNSAKPQFQNRGEPPASAGGVVSVAHAPPTYVGGSLGFEITSKPQATELVGFHLGGSSVRKGVLAQLGTGPHAAMLDLTESWHKEYAAQHGLAYVARRELILPNCPAPWSKVPLILDLLLAGHAPVVWMDADVVVVDGERDISRACDDGIGCVFYDEPWPHFNTGVMVLWPTPEVVELVCEVLRFAGQPNGLPPTTPGGGYWEQPYFNFLDAGRGILRRISPDWNAIEGITPCERVAVVAAHGQPAGEAASRSS